MNVVAELARRAAEAEPPPLDELTARRMVERALAGAGQAEPPRRSRAWWTPVIALGMVGAAALGWWLHPVAPPAPRETLKLVLPTGDRLVGADGAQFDVARLDPGDRRVTLHGGTLLADVAHVVPGQHFEITTAQLAAIAKGTVFSVEADARRSRVRVYEGVVEVVQDRAHHLVPAGGTWASDAKVVVASAEQPPALRPDIVAALTAPGSTSSRPRRRRRRRRCP